MAIVENLENSFAFKYSSENGLNGEPLVLSFPAIEERYFELTIRNWFNGTQPFMLWGQLDFKLSDYVVIDAIDLHIGHQIFFEISREWMRVYLPSHSCGNTVARLLVNLQQHFSSSIRVENKNFEKLLKIEL